MHLVTVHIQMRTQRKSCRPRVSCGMANSRAAAVTLACTRMIEVSALP